MSPRSIPPRGTKTPSAQNANGALSGCFRGFVFGNFKLVTAIGFNRTVINAYSFMVLHMQRNKIQVNTELKYRMGERETLLSSGSLLCRLRRERNLPLPGGRPTWPATPVKKNRLDVLLTHVPTQHIITDRQYIYNQRTGSQDIHHWCSVDVEDAEYGGKSNMINAN